MATYLFGFPRKDLGYEGHEGLGVERFLEDRPSAQISGPGEQRVGIAKGQKYERHPIGSLPRAQPCRKFQAAYSRQHDVQDEEVRIRPAGDGLGFFRARARKGDVAELLKRRTQRPDEIGGTIDQQDLLPGHFGIIARLNRLVSLPALSRSRWCILWSTGVTGHGAEQ